MRIPFRSRPRADLDDLDDSITGDEITGDESEGGNGAGPSGAPRRGLEPATLAVPEVDPYDAPLVADHYDDEDDEPGSDTLLVAPAPQHRDGPPDDRHLDGGVGADELSAGMERIRSEASAEQRSAWAYLGLLFVIFALLVVVGYASRDRSPAAVAGAGETQRVTGGEPARLVFRFDGDVVVVQGSVPDQAAKDQLLAIAQDIYGAENVVDEVVVDEGTTLESGTVRFVGTAAFGDERPQALQEAVSASFGLANRGFEVGFVETALDPVLVEVAVSNTTVAVSGLVPDDQSLADFVAVATEVWGPDNVDAGNLGVGETSWTGGLIRVIGSTVDSDQRIGVFAALVSERIDALVTVDTSGLTVGSSPERIAEVQATIDQLVADSPIRFGPDSAVIESSSDAVLVEVAAALDQIPDVPFEVVGHTDNVGPDEDNLVLSQERAAAVVVRLSELGVDPARMSSRGEGEANPIADNSTAEGKAANRRIEFILAGTSDGAGR